MAYERQTKSKPQTADDGTLTKSAPMPSESIGRHEGSESLSRWFRVIHPVWDCQIAPRAWKAYPQGAIGFETAERVSQGVAIGAIERIERPAGYSVGKDGNVYQVSEDRP